ncbi:MAG: alanine racemase [Gammaproteobacteria bacterium]|nr:alanine racemase [Gammaproteobacteria bacterium]MDH5803424.1 alanine racemase [Gammaproteobacteria bacterium]
MSRATRAGINLSALQHNLECARQYAPGRRIVAIIKANAYGHGVLRVANALHTADAYGVASLDEALLLRLSGITSPILLLEGFFHTSELAEIDHNKLDMVIHSLEQIRGLQQNGFFERPQQSTLWLKLDSGMHRLGFSVEEFHQALTVVQQSGFKFVLMSHLACADDTDNSTTEKQIRFFDDHTHEVNAPRSLANSAGILAWPQSHRDWVRPGIMLYGGSPLLDQSAQALGLRPVMTLSTELIAIKQLKKGDAIGYGGTWVCPEQMSVGVAAIGYGDGYPRHAPTGTPVLVNGVRCQLLGRVSMDMITVDLRACPQARVGDNVTLWGDGLPADEIALQAGTISYELFCGITGRVEFTETEV